MTSWGLIVTSWSEEFSVAWVELDSEEEEEKEGKLAPSDRLASSDRLTSSPPSSVRCMSRTGTTREGVSLVWEPSREGISPACELPQEGNSPARELLRDETSSVSELLRVLLASSSELSSLRRSLASTPEVSDDGVSVSNCGSLYSNVGGYK